MSTCKLGPTVKLHTLAWGQQFKMVGNAATFTYERGNGMYPWVSWQEISCFDDTETPDGRGLITKRGSMYIGQEVRAIK